MNEARLSLRAVAEAFHEKLEAVMNWGTKDASKGVAVDAGAKGNLSFAGNGKVSVSVASIVKSERVQQQVKAVREIAVSQGAVKK